MANKFFKVFLSSHSSQKLDICIAFVSRIGGHLPDRAVLRNSFGQSWEVKMTKVGSVFSFTEGWEKFVDGNKIQHAEFLVFSYNGENEFSVIVYGHNTCNKGVSAPESCCKKENEAESDGESKEEPDVNTGSEEDETYMDTEDDDKEEKEVFDAGKRAKGKMIKSAKRVQISEGKRKSVSSPKPLRKVPHSSNDNRKGKCAAKTEAETSDDEEEDVFKYGIIARPKNPYFVSKIRETRKNSMHIPVDVIRDHKLDIPSNIVILDEENKEWESEVKMWADGRTWITTGFKAFKKWNELKKEDRCLCEFVKDSGSGALVLKIRILRKGSWLPNEL